MEISGVTSLLEYVSISYNLVVIYSCRVLPPGQVISLFVAKWHCYFGRLSFIFHIVMAMPFSLFNI